MAKFGVILACLILRTVFSQTKGGTRGLMSLSEYMDRYIEVKVTQGLAGVKKDLSAQDEAFQRVIREVNTLTANVQCLKRQEEGLRKHVKHVDKEQFLCKQAIEKQQKEFDAKLDLWYADINITKQLLDLHEESDAEESRISIQETCPDQWTEYQDSCYFLFKFDLAWTQGSYMCGLQGGYLASIESEVENDFIKSYLQTNAHGNNVWIGATDMMARGIYRWVEDDGVVSFTNWGPGEPGGSEHCVEARAGYSYRWNDEYCSYKKYFLCERRKQAEHKQRIANRNQPEQSSSRGSISARRPCPDQWTQYQSSCYLLIEHDLDWIQANYMCGLQGGYLASIESEVENNFIKRYLRTNQGYSHNVWIGATDMRVRGIYRWVEDDAVVSFTNWGPGEPGGSEHCVEARAGYSYRWNDEYCSYKKHFLCERRVEGSILG